MFAPQTTARRPSRWRMPVVAALLCFFVAQQSAYADLWAYVDSRGVTHFAAEQIDANYALFFRGDQFDSTRDGASERMDPPDYSLESAARNAGARKLAFIDISPGYKRVRTHIRGAAETYGLEYELLKAVIATESGFDSQAISPKGAVGLMQLMPATASRFGVASDKKRSVAQKLEDPATNLGAGASYLRYLLKMFDGRKDLALAAYNAGEGAVQRAGNQIPAYRETQNYVKSVLGLYAMLKPPEPIRAHRAHQAQQAVPGRIRMEIPAGNAGETSSPTPDSSTSSTTHNSPLGAAARSSAVHMAARAQLQDLSANE
ncbi:lytic transglycosylase domain-containing protein [Diaphorobacter sp. HDW4A]|uniref:lytic transglycosylase domain-containing protein n=1 Tax=Diaphorobacter sp. HDW4A TaxID=2714924 RepID=UPI00140935B6|nr:lytic transglycosylase domain-containing protein [Diaphorobacter sp. HDW4A]